MSRPMPFESLLLSLEAMTQRLQETDHQIEAVSANLKRPRWLHPVQRVTRKLARRTLQTLPRATRQVQDEWTKAARDRLKRQYGDWAKELAAVRDRVRTLRHDKAK